MKIFYFGGQKSGKTKAGIKKALELSKDEKPYYVATMIILLVMILCKIELINISLKEKKIL